MPRSDAARDAEAETVQADVAAPFWREHERDWRSDLWNFRVVWHEQTHHIVVRDEGRIVGAVNVRIAASLAHIEALYVLPEQRRRGHARALLTRGEEIANYFNCHKVSAAVFAGQTAQRVFERCGYTVEAILPQHTFKLDVAMLRKFLL